MAKKVKTIPAKINRIKEQPAAEQKKRRVAGYARVSTEMEEQQTSYEAQMDYYSNYIQSRPDWEYVGMYSDEGITATSTKRREGFKQMVKDALDGKIDLIVTKSISRFARNTVDFLSTIRRLKEHGVEIFFEKENIWTFDAKGELLITIMSSLAQEESRSISENTTWGLRKKFADGKGSIAFGHFLGYDRGENGEFVINEEQAETVRQIYKLYLSGYSYCGIAKEMEREGRLAPAGGKRWNDSTVRSILKNEKYKGDALLQKAYTVDFLTRKMAKNNGEIPQYYVEGHHEPIVSAEQFQMVQNEIRRRKEYGVRYSGQNIFSSKIICGECGGIFGSKTWHSNDKYKRIVWYCNNRYDQGKGKKGLHCKTGHITGEKLREQFIQAMEGLVADKQNIIDDLHILIETASDTEGLQDEVAALTLELDTLVRKMERMVDENARTASDQIEYEKRYNKLVDHYNEKKERYERLMDEIESAQASAAAIGELEKTIGSISQPIGEIWEDLWSSLIETVTVTTDHSVVFHFRGGFKIKR